MRFLDSAQLKHVTYIYMKAVFWQLECHTNVIYMQTYVHTYIHRYIHTHARAHARTHASIHVYPHVCSKQVIKDNIFCDGK